MKLITNEDIDNIAEALKERLCETIDPQMRQDWEFAALDCLQESLGPWREEESNAQLEIQVQRMYRFDTGRPLKAFVDIIINDALLIKGVRIMQIKNGLDVQMPREQAKDKKWYDSIRCLTKEAKEQITKVVLEVYKEE